MPTAPPSTDELLVADSWRVRHGQNWGLTDHIQRFSAGMAAQASGGHRLPVLDPVLFEAVLHNTLAELWRQHPDVEFFPRISVEPHRDTWRLVLLVRPAPQPRATTSLWLPKYPDPRTKPTVKGPDISLLRSLVSDVPTDDLVLHDGTTVHEATTGALLVWQAPDHLVLCQAERQLASISVQRIANYARAHHIAVTTRPVTIAELTSRQYPIWFSNTLHGISPVTTISSATEEQEIVAHPAARRWQAAWWARFQA